MTPTELRKLIDRIEQVGILVRTAELLGYREKNPLKRKAYGVQWKQHWNELVELRKQLNEEIQTWISE